MGSIKLIQWTLAIVWLSIIILESVAITSAQDGTMDRQSSWGNTINRDFRNNNMIRGGRKWRKRNGLGRRINSLDRELSYGVQRKSRISKSKEFCCPVTKYMIEPDAGKNKSGHLVELYKGKNQPRQRFHEIACADGVAMEPCRFVLVGYQSKSRCVQQHTYTYALVQGPGPGEHSLDYIQIRSGCACEVMDETTVNHIPSKRGR